MSTDGSALGYPELLRLATSKGLTELDSTIVQIPSDANGGHGVVLAAARTGTGLFRAVGEAWRDTLPASQQPQTLTVAEVRAKTRALCEAVGMPQPLAAAPLLESESPTASIPTPRTVAQPVPRPVERPAVPAAPQPIERPGVPREEFLSRPDPLERAPETGSAARIEADPVRRVAEQATVAASQRAPGGDPTGIRGKAAARRGAAPAQPGTAPEPTVCCCKRARR